ncbi:ABC transporter permease [Actinocorallia libanotica]|uniref:Transporter n=1 Tax=Actinocorallia libanotica TaxID=46162 RepID=A0ABN1QKV4_9ACTN
MIWLSWRQFRFQACVGAVALALGAAYLLYLGMEIRDAHDAALARCGGSGDCGQALGQFQVEYRAPLIFLALGLGLALALIGGFWGAPLVAREFEAGTHRLVWNQSVSRPRWFATRLAFVALAGMIMAGAAGMLLTWAAAPVDEVAGDRFGTITFGARHLAPAAYAVFAVVFGTVVGLLIRRTLPAMAITMAGLIAFQFFVPNVVRPHLMTPERTTLAMTTEAVNQARNLGNISGGAVIGGITLPDHPDAWISRTSPLLTADGSPLAEDVFGACLDDPPKTGTGGTFGDTAACLGRLDLHLEIDYHPAARYWTFQWLEAGFCLLLSALLAAFGLWRLRRGTD